MGNLSKTKHSCLGGIEMNPKPSTKDIQRGNRSKSERDMLWDISAFM
jgi:hypothetical protein